MRRRRRPQRATRAPWRSSLRNRTKKNLGPRFRRGDALADSLVGELGPVLELLQRLGIGERLDVLHRAAVHHIAHRELDDLAALGARDVRHLADLGRHMARRSVVADAALDAVHHRLVELEPLAQLDEEYDAHVALPVLADYQRLDHLLELLHLAVDIGGARARPARGRRRAPGAGDEW